MDRYSGFKKDLFLLSALVSHDLRIVAVTAIVVMGRHPSGILPAVAAALRASF